MVARFHDRGSSPVSLEARFRAWIDTVPFQPGDTAPAPGRGGIPLHTPAQRWYERCQQMWPNGETNTNNPERETA
jgi:hypothetical protein